MYSIGSPTRQRYRKREIWVTFFFICWLVGWLVGWLVFCFAFVFWRVFLLFCLFWGGSSDLRKLMHFGRVENVTHIVD